MMVNELYLIALFTPLKERRSSDRRLPTAERLFANADLKIGVPSSYPAYEVNND
jgi:hypothetical protein